MVDGAVWGRTAAVFVGCALAACGGSAQDSGLGNHSAAGAAGFEPGAPSGQSGAAAEAAAGETNAVGGAIAAGGSDQATGAGQAGAADIEPPANVAARWTMFHFEDPVGLDMSETDGVLSGQGCAGGAPSPDDALTRTIAGFGVWCGAVSGKVSGHEASFRFSFEERTYAAETTASADGSRMTGRFRAGSEWEPYPMAWLRIADGEIGLPGPDDPQPYQSVDLRLSAADSGATEYVAGKVYRVNYFHSSFSGDLGAFAYIETKQASPDAPIIVGPVATTVPELPVSMVVQVQNKQLTEFKVVTGAAHHFTFSASPHVD
ncbi:MAG: hypothetical protein ABJB12_18570 [Pseudomonadota bacterium]